MEEALNPLAEAIISLLLFEERYDAIIAELSNAKEFVIADEIKSLMVKDYIKPCRDIENNNASGILYDSDKMKAYSFTLTARGISYLENNMKLK